MRRYESLCDLHFPTYTGALIPNTFTVAWEATTQQSDAYTEALTIGAEVELVWGLV